MQSVREQGSIMATKGRQRDREIEGRDVVKEGGNVGGTEWRRGGGPNKERGRRERGKERGRGRGGEGGTEIGRDEEEEGRREGGTERWRDGEREGRRAGERAEQRGGKISIINPEANRGDEARSLTRDLTTSITW